MAAQGNRDMDRLVALCRRRGFIFQSSEIYGGLNGFWDYGPLGVELKRNVKEAWWFDMVTRREDIVGLDSAIIMNPKVWEASGHVAGFSDPMVDCRTCKARFRADQLGETPCPRKPSRMVGQHSECDLTEPRAFNLMFKTYVGALEDSSSVAYLRPETAQGIFVNFRNIVDTTRVKVPFGIAQIGKAFRNEINPRNFTFRSREFEQMEIEFFCHPDEASKWFEYWRDVRFRWYVDLGLRSDRLRLRDHEADELAHYAAACADIEYEFPFGVSELEGIANRTDYDLKRHAEYSGKDLSYFDHDRKQRYVPYVIEPSAGVDRSVLAFLCEAYTLDESRPSPEILRLHPRLAPIKAAVFPLVNRDGMPERAERIYREVKARWPAQFDAKQSIGKRYARMDEAGTPFCFTIDGQTLQDGTVTVRDRDTGHQIRIHEDQVVAYLAEHLPGVGGCTSVRASD